LPPPSHPFSRFHKLTESDSQWLPSSVKELIAAITENKQRSYFTITDCNNYALLYEGTCRQVDNRFAYFISRNTGVIVGFSFVLVKNVKQLSPSRFRSTAFSFYCGNKQIFLEIIE